MSDQLAKQLNESHRDALLSYYESYVAPLFGETGAITDEDIYQYLLIDPDVTEAVDTSEVAQAISSLQQYLYRIALNQEPGFNPMQQADLDEWRSIESQYAIWSATQQVSDYPENYVTPSSRQDKSKFFRDLENTLNQNQLDADRVQDAVLTYLNEFEGVSNLLVINGYCDQADFSKGKYFFIGKTAEQPYRYYWRSMDMSKNGGSKSNPIITPNCWNDWQLIDLPLNADTVLSWTIRPVYFNNRLYVTWAERNPEPTETGGKIHQYTVHYGYLRYDDTWTAPALGELQEAPAGSTSRLLPGGALLINESNSFNPQSIDTCAVVDFNRGTDGSERVEGNLFIGIFRFGQTVEGWFRDRAFVYCDISMTALTTTSVAMDGNFDIYDGYYNTYTGYRANTILCCSLGRKYAVVEGSLRYSTSGTKSWGDSFPTPTVSLRNDGITLQIDTMVGNCPETASDPDYRNLWHLDGTEYRCEFEYSAPIDDALLSQGSSNTGSVRYTINNNVVTIPDLYLTIGSLPVFGDYHYRLLKGIVHIQFRTDRSDLFYEKFDNIDLRLRTPIPIPLSFPLPMVSQNTATVKNQVLFNVLQINEVYQQEIETRFRTTNLVNFYATSARSTFQPSLLLETQNSKIKLESISSLPPLQTYEPGYPLTFTHRIHPIDDFPDVNGKFNYRINAQMTQRAIDGALSRSGTGHWTFQVELVSETKGKRKPTIKTRYDNNKGTVQFLAFTYMEDQFKETFTPSPTRLNTTFVPLLIAKASIGLNMLLSYYTQATRVEPPFLVDAGLSSELETMDYNGANGLYFWELFFHVPFMVASRFASEGQNDLAQSWLHYLFDPAARQREMDAVNHITPPDYWNNYAISTGADQSRTNSFMTGALLDPDALAYANPVIYEKTVFLNYIKTVIAMGDSHYRMLTPDDLTAARVYYDLCTELLGPSPVPTLSWQWEPMALQELAGLKSSGLRSFEQNADIGLLELPSRCSSALVLLDNPKFRAPLNSELLSYWKTVNARLYNLRNNLSIDGKPLNLPLFAAPADPRALLSQRAAGGSQGSSALTAMQIMLPYRFQAMLPIATSAVSMLTQYGDLLLSFIERGEAAQQVELGQQQMVDLSGFAISLQKQELNALNADAESLRAQKAIADQRYDFYWDNYNENISPVERLSMDLQQQTAAVGTLEKALYIAAGGADLVPNIYGMANGGSHWGAATRAVGEGLGLARQALEIQSSRLAQTESYRRRRDDWQEQYIQAQLESEMIGKQLDALAIRQQAVQTSIEQATLQQAQQKAMLKFLNARFTQASLYQWLNGQLSALYYQAYDSVLSLCLNVQSCWQYEQGDFATTFVRTSAWNNSYRGLLAGQALTLDLHKMERAYYARYDRQLNISRTVSLKALLSAQGKDFEQEKKKGRFENFKLTEEFFDAKSPGDYARRLHKVSVTLPTLLGPYQDVSARLTQTSSSTLFKPEISGVKALLDGTTPPASSGVVTNLRPSQQVALSGGLADDGTFALLVQDGRYLPFEGTGAVSGWTLEFPRSVDEKIGNATFAADPEQKALLDALDDVLIHIEYTALNGGASFAEEVRKALHEKTQAATEGTPKRLVRKPGGERKSASRKQ